MLLCVCVFVRFGLLALSSTFTGNLRFIRLLCYDVGATEKKELSQTWAKRKKDETTKKKKIQKFVVHWHFVWGYIWCHNQACFEPTVFVSAATQAPQGVIIMVVMRCAPHNCFHSFVFLCLQFFFLLSFVWTAKHLWAVYYRTLLVYTQHAHTHVSLLNKRNFWLGIIMLRCVFTSPQQWPSLTLFFLYIFAISPAISGQRWRSVVFNLLD